jgi:diguanylate cyclase (GGDEF)-like protein
MPNPSRSIPPFVVNRRQAIERTLAGLKLLPSNSAVAMKVLELKRRHDAGAADFAIAISADAALSTKILAVANSAAFAPVTPVTRVSHAIAQIGLSNLLPLVFGLSFAGIFNKLSLPAEDQGLLWKSSLLKAVTARQCVCRFGTGFKTSEQRDAAGEEAFLAGLIQDAALPVFCAADRAAWPEFLAVLDGPDADRANSECRIYGIDHATAGAKCTSVLQLPALFGRVAQSHHGGVEALTAAAGPTLAIAVGAAASLPHRLPSLSGRVLQPFATRLQKATGKTTTELAELVKSIAEEFNRLAGMFAEPEDQSASFKQFLQNLGAEVADCLQSSMLSSAAEIHVLREREKQLGQAVAALEDRAQRAEFDPLTNLLTRTAFLARLAKLFPLARRHGAGCAIGYLDLDDFKQINDTHGHAVGDASLAAAAKLLLATLRNSGIAGRMGGDELVFAFVARPDVLDQMTTNFVGRLAKVAVAEGDVRLDLTTSIGVALLGVPGPQTDALAALREADRLMYEAKRSGKGRGAVARTVLAQTSVQSSAA